MLLVHVWAEGEHVQASETLFSLNKKVAKTQ